MATFTVDREAALAGVTCIENILILDYFKEAPGDYVKVLLCALMQLQNPTLSNEDMALSLNMSDGNITAAFEYWQKRGVLRIMSDNPMVIEFLTVKPLTSYAPSQNAKYYDLLDALRDVMGSRVFTATELKVVYDWLEIFGLSKDAVVKLVTYCIDLKGRAVSIRYMDTVARGWADMRLYTSHDIDEHLSKQNGYMLYVRDIKKRWRLSRNITEDELALYKKWNSEWKIPHEVIMEACSDAVYASNPSFAYLDSVLAGYRERGTVDMEAVDAYRKKRMLSDEVSRRLFEKVGIKRKPTLQQRDRIDTWLNDWRIPEDALMLLGEKAAAYSRPFEYISKVVASWNERDIRNLDAAKKDLSGDNKPRVSPDRKFSPKANYSQRRYTEADLIKLGIDVSGDVNGNN